MKLEITKERVLEAASKCSTAKATLTTLFPEAFGTPLLDEFEQELANLINRGQFYEDVYSKIPGDMSAGKAKHIVKLLGLKK